MPVPKKQDYWIQQSTKHVSFDSEYALGKEIGRGPTSIVYKCERRGLGHTWAVKILHKNLDKRVQLADVGMLLKLDHKNLVRFKEVFESRSRIFIIQELVTGGELFDRVVNVGSYSELMAARAVRDIVNGLFYLHSCGYAVRNLKPENLLYANLSEESELKISDFALSSVLSPEVDVSSVCGSPAYVAPEVLKGERHGMAVDMWTLGVITYILLCGYEPFMSDNPAELFKKILKGSYEFLPRDWDYISYNGADFVRKLLVLNPTKRLTSAAAAKNCWVNASAAMAIPLDDVVLRIKDFNLRRREKAEMLQVAQTPRASRMCSRATPYPDEEFAQSSSPVPEIQITNPEPDATNNQPDQP